MADSCQNCGHVNREWGVSALSAPCACCVEGCDAPPPAATREVEPRPDAPGGPEFELNAAEKRAIERAEEILNNQGVGLCTIQGHADLHAKLAAAERERDDALNQLRFAYEEFAKAREEK
jgi:hypothetical protein